MTKTRKLYAAQELLQTAGITLRTLQVYEELGFVSPTREEADSCLYPEEALETLLRVQRLRRELGVNLAGVEVILEMRRKIEALQRELEEVLRFVQSDLPTELETFLKQHLGPEDTLRRSRRLRRPYP
jgi:MerR family transcriptional regulator/heat shock protein HspR